VITVETAKKASLRELKYRNYADFRRVLELYDKWDVAARDKDFFNAEHFEYEIQRIHQRNGVQET